MVCSAEVGLNKVLCIGLPPPLGHLLIAQVKKQIQRHQGLVQGHTVSWAWDLISFSLCLNFLFLEIGQ